MFYYLGTCEEFMKFIFSIFLLAIIASFSFSIIYAEEYPLMVSVSPDGEPGNENSYLATLSSNGAYVVFMSKASNLVDDDRNHSMDIFVRDIVNRETYLVSITSDGLQKAHESNYPSISGDGNLVTFYTRADFDSDDVNQHDDVYLHNIRTGETIWVSAPIPSSQTGESNQPQGHGAPSVISENGEQVLFRSNSRDLGSESDGNLFLFDVDSRTTTALDVYASDFDISGNGKKIVFTAERESDEFPDMLPGNLFVYDVDTKKIIWISKPIDEFNIQATSDLGTLDFDGKFLAFRSGVPNLVENDENNETSFFLHDLQTSQTKLISISPEGDAFFANSHVDISGDGKFVLLPERGLLVYDIELEKIIQLTTLGSSDGGINFDGSLVASTQHNMNDSQFSQVFVTTNPPPDEILRQQAEIEAEHEADEKELAALAEAEDEREEAEKQKAISDALAKREAERAAEAKRDLEEKKSKIASFVDKTKDPQYYVDRYNNEPKYKEWFDENYPQYDSIEQAVGLELTEKIPSWVKNIFGWYAADEVSEEELLNAIKYLINEKILIVN